MAAAISLRHLIENCISYIATRNRRRSAAPQSEIDYESLKSDHDILLELHTASQQFFEVMEKRSEGSQRSLDCSDDSVWSETEAFISNAPPSLTLISAVSAAATHLGFLTLN